MNHTCIGIQIFFSFVCFLTIIVFTFTYSINFNQWKVHAYVKTFVVLDGVYIGTEQGIFWIFALIIYRSSSVHSSAGEVSLLANLHE